MRKRFEAQLALGAEPIEQVVIRTKSRDELPPALVALQELYKNKDLSEQIFNILEAHITEGKQKTGRTGMDLWQILVFSVVRLTLDTNYDKLHDMANNHKDFRKILGVHSFIDDKEFEIQTIKDNVQLVTDDMLYQINEIIAKWGHKFFKKKEAEFQQLKTDSFVVKTNVHFPTDYNLLWDSARKCLDVVCKLLKSNDISAIGWRKINDWRKTFKNFSRQIGQISAKGGTNKEQVLNNVVNQYIVKSKQLLIKVQAILNGEIKSDKMLDKLLQLEYYAKMLEVHSNLLFRRIIQKETIPNSDKIHSIFLNFTEWISKGKLYPNVELGKKVLITTNQNHLIVDYQVLDNTMDSETLLPLTDRIWALYPNKISTWSFDKGFTNYQSKKLMESYDIKVIIPKKGKKNKSETIMEQSREFKHLKHKHSAIESNINELEHNGLDFCPDRSRSAFNRYIGLGVMSYNLHRIGKKIVEQRRNLLKISKAA